MDHNPPHFHAEYGEYRVLINITKGYVENGFLPSKQLKIVLAWCEIHREELLENWKLSEAGEPLRKINPII
jgi:hypothetical protein